MILSQSLGMCITTKMWRREEMDEEILEWYIIGCKIVQDPKMTPQNKNDFRECLITLRRMVESDD